MVVDHHAQPPQCRCGTRLARDNPMPLCAACQASIREQAGGPAEVPASFWRESRLLAALSSRHMGRVIRDYRLHPDHGRTPIKQTTVADWLCITQAQLSRIESGPPPMHLDRLIHWAQVLGIPAEHLWFKLPEEPGSVPDDQELVGGIAEVNDVRRADFLRLSGAAVAGLAAPGILVRGAVRVVAERECAEWLAWELWRHGERAIHASDLPLSIAQYLGVLDPTGRLALGRNSISPEGFILGDSDGFFSFTQASLIDFFVGQRISSSVRTGTSRLLATAQTSHATDLVIQAFVARHRPSVTLLARWMRDSSDPVLRVNSAGILAKLGVAPTGNEVATILRTDHETRRLYLTAVTHRALAVDWKHGAELTATLEAGGAAPNLSAEQVVRLTTELRNPRDAAARWCSAVLLAPFQNSASDVVRPALHRALKDESCPENQRAFGSVLAGTNPLTV